MVSEGEFEWDFLERGCNCYDGDGEEYGEISLVWNEEMDGDEEQGCEVAEGLEKRKG